MVLLHRGKRVYQGTIKGLGAGDRARLVIRTVDLAHLSVVQDIAADHGYTATRDGDRLIIDSPADFAGTLNAEAMRRGAVIRELAVESTTLEERFVAMTGEEVTP
ncbi:MAG: hypothetical protein ACRDZV_00060 [Acidimicrobiia bacterium]